MIVVAAMAGSAPIMRKRRADRDADDLRQIRDGRHDAGHRHEDRADAVDAFEELLPETLFVVPDRRDRACDGAGHDDVDYNCTNHCHSWFSPLYETVWMVLEISPSFSLWLPLSSVQAFTLAPAGS